MEWIADISMIDLNFSLLPKTNTLQTCSNIKNLVKNLTKLEELK